MNEQEMHCPEGQTEIPTESGYVCIGKPTSLELARRGSNLPSCSEGQTVQWDKATSDYICVGGPNVQWSVLAGPMILFGAVFIIVILLMLRKKDK